MSTGEALAAINLTISASTERQWQEIRRPRGRNPRADVQALAVGTMPIGIRTMTRRRAIAHAGCCRDRIPAFIGSAITSAALRRWLAGERWVRRLAIVDRGFDGDLRRLLRRAVVAARRRSDQSRYGDAVAGRGDRGKYRPRQYRRGRRHPDRAGRAESASRCASATSSSGIATMPSWRARRKPR